MHIQSHFAETRSKHLRQLIAAHPLATFVAAVDGEQVVASDEIPVFPGRNNQSPLVHPTGKGFDDLKHPGQNFPHQFLIAGYPAGSRQD